MKSCLLWAAALALALSPMRAHAGSTKLNPNLLYQEQYSGAPTPDVLPTETHVTANSTSIGTLTTGVATNASGITAEVAARQTAVSAEATARAAAVTAEQTRAEAAEGTISGTAATNTSAITAETTRAETAEGVNASGLTAEVADRQTAISGEATARTAAVSAETTRAEGVEGTLTTGVSANAANITAETTARQTAVTGEATARTAAIGVETTRAEGAESTLTTAAAAAQTTANAAFPTISAGPLATQAGANSAAAIAAGGGVVSAGGNVSATTVTVAGGTARPLATALNDTINVLNILPQTNSTTDYTSVINTIVAAGKTAFLPNTGTPYHISGSLTFNTAGASLLGQPGTTIAVTTNNTIFQGLAPNITFQDITFDATALGTASKPQAYISYPNFRWTGGGMHYTGPTYLNSGASYAKISGIKYDYSSSGGIYIEADHDRVTDSNFNNNFGFSIFATGGATYFQIIDNQMDSNAIEGIATGYAAHYGIISDNKVFQSADNCISISGDNNTITGNQALDCLGNGISIYGDLNTVTGNKMIDNNQVANPSAPAIALWNGTSKAIYQSAGYGSSYSGLTLVSANGGYAQLNTVTGNTLYDDQTTATQHGMTVGAGTTVAVVGQTVTSGEYVYNAGNTYQVTSASGGVTTSLPTGTTTYTDGSIVYTYCSTTPLATREAAGNTIGPNNIYRFAGSADITDTTSNHNNSIWDASYTSLTQGNSIAGIGTSPNTIKSGGFQVVAPSWTSGTTTYSYGATIQSNGFTYRLASLTTPGAASNNAPSGTTNGSIVVGADGYGWMCLNQAPVYANSMTFPNGTVSINAPLALQDIASITANAYIYSGTGAPSGVVAAPIGSLFLREDGGANTTLYVKESTSGTLGWIPYTGTNGHLISTGTSPTTSNGTLDATATDTKGTVTEGTASTGATITFAAPYASAPDCVVTSPTGSALTSYTPSTTTLVIVNASATADKFTYHCIQ